MSDQKTKDKFNSGKIMPGDTFLKDEFWRFVVKKNGDRIITLEGSVESNYSIRDYTNFREFHDAFFDKGTRNYSVEYLGTHLGKCNEYLSMYKKSLEWPVSFSDESLNISNKRKLRIDKILYGI